MRDFAFSDQLRAVLDRNDVISWLLTETSHSVAPTFNDSGQLVFRFDDSAEADRFEAKWLGEDDEAMADKQHKFTVSGVDCHGDVHTLSTDNRARAQERQRQMFENLGNVEFVENG